jgi:hypothetical protein
MNRKIRLYAAVVLVALFVAGCSGPCATIKPINAPAAKGGNASFATYVALGTSISAGGQSGGLVETHQAYAFPALFARQAGTSAFTYDRISPDGIPALLRLVSLSPLVIDNTGRTTGAPRDLAQPTPYHNLGVYGSLLYDCDSTTYYTISPYAAFFGMVARGQGSLLHQAAALEPTFVSFEYGANEVLGPALAGSGTPLFSVPQFTGILAYTLADLHTLMPDAKLAIFNVPDVTSIPYVNTIKPYVVHPANGSHIPLLCSEDADHPAGRLNEDDYVLLTATTSLQAGTGVPIPLGGNGNPLPNSQVLTASEAATLQAAVDGYNAAIAAAAATHGAALVDLNGLFARIASTGYDYRGVHYSGAFVTGGLFSLDGVHPTDLSQGLLANAMISAVNARFGAAVPLVDLGEVATLTSSRARPAQEEGAAAWPTVEGLDEMLKVFTARR